MTTRRRPESHELAASVLRFVAGNESLATTRAQFTELSEGELREILLASAEHLHPTTQREDSQRGQLDLALGQETTAAAECGLRSAVLHTDGASRGNPGPAGAGWVLYDQQGTVIDEGGAFLGRKTNNEAEYHAVLLGLAAARAHGVDEIVLKADSQLLVRQLLGAYRVRNAQLKPLFEKAKKLMGAFTRAEVSHVYREQNKAADKAANRAIDGTQVSPRNAR